MLRRKNGLTKGVILQKDKIYIINTENILIYIYIIYIYIYVCIYIYIFI